MPLSGKALATAYVIVRADMSAVAGDVQKGTSDAVTRGSQSASRKLKGALATPIKEGLAEGARAAEPGGAAVGGRFRQGVTGKLRGIGADTTKAGQDAGAGIDRGIGGKMRDVAATTSKGGKAAGEGFSREAGKATRKGGQTAGEEFSREAGKATEKGGGYVARAGRSTAGELVKGFAAAEIGMKAIDLFSGFIADARESAKIGAITEQVIKSTGGAARLSADDISALATSVSNKTGVDDEAIQSGENLLLTFTNVRDEAGKGNDVFSRATGIMTDMSVALGQDMSSSAIQLGKALNDPIKGVTALQRVGVSFTAQQKAQIKTLVESGKTLDAQKLILTELGREFGGAAAAAATPVDRLRVIAGNLGEQIGTALIPVVDKVATILGDDVVPAVSSAVTWLAKVPAPVYEGAAAAVALYGAFKVGQGIFSRVSDLVKTLGTGMQWMGLRTGEAAAAETAQTAAAGAQAAANDTAAASTTRLGSAMGLLAKGAGIVGLAAIAVQVDQWAGSATSAKVNTDQLSTSLTQLGRTGQTSGAALDVFKQGWGPFSQDVHNGGQAITEFGNLAKGALGGANESWLDFIGRMQSGSDRMGRLKSITEQYDASLTKMVAGGSATEAKAVFDQLAGAAQKQGVSLDAVRALFPQYTAAVAASSAATAPAATAASMLERAQTALAAATGANTTAQAGHTSTLGALVALYPKYKDTVLAAVGAEAAAAGKDAVLTAAQVAAATAAVQHKQALDRLTDSLQANNNAVLQNRGGETAYWAALQATKDALQQNGRTLDVHTTKGRANRTALDGLASASLNYLGTIQKNNGVGPVFRRTLDQQWTKLRDAALRFGATKTEAKRYADQILQTPKALATKVTVPGMAGAKQQIRNLAVQIQALKSKTLEVRIDSHGNAILHDANVGGHKDGGYIRGAGGPRDDKIPARLSNGEFVVNAAATSQHRQVLEAINAGRNPVAVAPRKYASGGLVTRELRAHVTAHMPKHLTADILSQINPMAIFAGGGGPIPGGSGVARWAPMMTRALAAVGLPLSLLANELRQIATESGGNPRAIQGDIGDVNNASGDLAKGLLQVIGATFRAYHAPGTSNNVFDPWANMLASLRYQKARYGSRIASVIGHGHGYAAGTTNAEPGWQWVGEHGRELVKFGGGEDVKSATASRAVENADDGFMRLHPDTVALLGNVIGTALARQPIVLDGRAVAGYVDRSMGRSSLSMRG